MIKALRILFLLAAVAIGWFGISTYLENINRKAYKDIPDGCYGIAFGGSRHDVRKAMKIQHFVCLDSISDEEVLRFSPDMGYNIYYGDVSWTSVEAVFVNDSLRMFHYVRDYPDEESAKDAYEEISYVLENNYPLEDGNPRFFQNSIFYKYVKGDSDVMLLYYVTSHHSEDSTDNYRVVLEFTKLVNGQWITYSH